MIYRLICGLIRLFLPFFAQLTVKGKGKLAQLHGQGYVVVANHSSYLDPLILAMIFDRPLHFMAKAEFFRNTLSAWFFRSLNAFPVRRQEADRKAIREAVRLLRAGHLVGLFPEGTRSRDGRLMPGKRGAQLLARLSGAPILPVGIKGTHRVLGRGRYLPRRGRIEVTIGEPFAIDSKARQRGESDPVMDKIAELI